MLPEEIQQLIETNLLNSKAIISGEDGQHFTAEIISDEFLNCKTIERQRLVYKIVGDYITNGSIHALSLKTYTKDEWVLK
jgi:acid stress-induced BolA-like protein IbaG/YrbA